MFGWFKKEKSIFDEIRDYAVHQETVRILQRANNLLKLGRQEEAADVFSEAEKIAVRAVRSSPKSVPAHLALAFFYQETCQVDSLLNLINRMLDSDQFSIDTKQRFMLSGMVQKIQSEKPISEKNTEKSIEDFSIVYSCQNCGRIIQYATMPCPHCQWYPTDISCLARSMVLSNPSLEIPSLLLLAREVARGRSPSEVVQNLDIKAKEYHEIVMGDTEHKNMFDMMLKDANMHYRDMNMVRQCSHCGENIISSYTVECASCRQSVNWPESIKLLVCMDNLMWFFENRAETVDSKEFSEFVCLLAVMINDLLRKQETPSKRNRSYALLLIRDMQYICDLNKGAVVKTDNLDELNLTLIEECMLEDSKQFGWFLCSELMYFVEKMKNGIGL